jgi:hypothetical protein
VPTRTTRILVGQGDIGQKRRDRFQVATYRMSENKGRSIALIPGTCSRETARARGEAPAPTAEAFVALTSHVVPQFSLAIHAAGVHYTVVKHTS